jgi:hypothetical protein
MKRPALGAATGQDVKGTHDGRQRLDALAKETHDGRQRLDDMSAAGKDTHDGRQEAAVAGEEKYSSTVCTSCKTLLKLASPMAVGKLVKCPKCGMVVPVVAPEEGPPAAEAKQPAVAPPPPALTRPAVAPLPPEAKRPLPEETETADYPAMPPEEEPAKDETGVLTKESLAKLAGAVAPKKRTELKLPSRRVLLAIGGVCALLLVVVGLVFGFSRGGTTKPSAKGPPTTEVKPEDMTFDIKLRSFPPAGASVVRSERNEQKGLRRILDGSKVVHEESIASMYEAEYNEVILDSGEGQPKKFKRTYRRAVEKIGDRIRLQSYQDRTVVFELVGDKYEAQAVGEPPLPADDLAGLARKISTQSQIAAFLPQGPVKISETWPINLGKFAQMIAGGGEVDIAASTGEGKLVQVRERADGRFFGAIKIDLKLAVKNMPGMQFNPPATLEYKATLDTAIDGSTTMGTLVLTGKLSGKGFVENKGRRFAQEVTQEFSGRQERSAEK